MSSIISTSTVPASAINRLRQTIAEIIADANSTSIDDQLKALHTLASITRVNPQNRLLVAQTPDAIATFLRLSKSSSVPGGAVVQTLSLSILFNLSLTPDLKHSLAELHTIHHLNRIILSASSPDAIKLAASLVCSLAMLDKNKAKFGVAGTVQALINAISYDNRVATSHHVLSCLAELVQFHGNCTLAVRAGAVPVLMAVLQVDIAEDLRGTSLAVLGLLGRFEEGLRAMRETEGVVAAMVEVLRGRCMLSKEGAAEILIRLFDESEVCLRDAVQMADLPLVLADVSVRGSVTAREKAALLLRKLTDASPDMFWT